MVHKRDLVLGIVLKQDKALNYNELLINFDDKHIEESKKSKKDSINLDNCFEAFSREELLTGTDQWFCSKCKEQRDILKKLELFRLPKILIL
jgi:ubiquitin C-terminal hydrolase